jgi:anti-sigma-K factor RskA
MSDDLLLDLAPLAALGALDSEDRRAFEARAATDAGLRLELLAFTGLVGRIGLATAAVEPSTEVRQRVLAAAASIEAKAPMVASGRGPSRWLSGLAAAIVLLAIGAFMMREQRDLARREAERARIQAETLQAQLRDALAKLEAAQKDLAEAGSFRALVAAPESQVASLAGLPPAAVGARARVVWNAKRREAVLLVSGLPAPPAGMAYEVWVIASAAPVPAGVFWSNTEGQAVHRLPSGDMAGVRTFAVTLEPQAGVPAPTGPMVLAGPAL